MSAQTADDSHAAMASLPQLLVVDDELPVRERLQRHFQRAGYGVEVAEDAVRALRTLENLRVDIVIADIKMPGMDGVDLLREIRADFPMIRVIMLAGYVPQEKILACMRHGAEACVLKPLDGLEGLEAAVAHAWAGIQQWWRVLADLGGRGGAVTLK